MFPLSDEKDAIRPRNLRVERAAATVPYSVTHAYAKNASAPAAITTHTHSSMCPLLTVAAFARAPRLVLP